MEPIVWLVIVVAALAIAAVVVALRQRSHARLRNRFGPEYDRAVERAGSRKEAEQELSHAANKRDELEIRELDPESQQRFTEEWAAIQARFVDAPASAVGSASALLTTVMQERGYPVDDDDERALVVAADHPEAIEHYRAAERAYDRYQHEGQGDTEDLRQSFMHYRELFAVLVPGVGQSADHSVNGSVNGSANGSVNGARSDGHAGTADVNGYTNTTEVQR
jgi:hypothetical protein